MRRSFARSRRSLSFRNPSGSSNHPRADLIEDLSDEWRTIVKARLRMFRAMREDTVARLGEERYQEYDQLYEFFVGLIEAGKLGGGRFSASR